MYIGFSNHTLFPQKLMEKLYIFAFLVEIFVKWKYG